MFDGNYCPKYKEENAVFPPSKCRGKDASGTLDVAAIHLTMGKNKKKTEGFEQSPLVSNERKKPKNTTSFFIAVA